MNSHKVAILDYGNLFLFATIVCRSILDSPAIG